MTQGLPLILRRLVMLHESLEDAGLDHAVGGALALAFHVRDPRGTSDIDINVIADPNDPDTVLAALPPEITIHPGARDELKTTGQTRLIWPDPNTPVDVFLPQHPVFHRVAVERGVPIDMAGTELKVLTATDLMVFKMYYNRTKDWADIESLLEAGAGDPVEAGQWIEEFLGPHDPRLERLRQTLATVHRPARPLHRATGSPSTVCGIWVPDDARHCTLAAEHPGEHNTDPDMASPL